jgi:hypothetical protein
MIDMGVLVYIISAKQFNFISVQGTYGSPNPSLAGHAKF